MTDDTKPRGLPPAPPTRTRKRYYHTTEELSRAAVNGNARRHGDTLVYIDGKPYSLQALAKEHGIALSHLSNRARKCRNAGKPITLEHITKPLRVR